MTRGIRRVLGRGLADMATDRYNAARLKRLFEGKEMTVIYEPPAPPKTLFIAGEFRRAQAFADHRALARGSYHIVTRPERLDGLAGQRCKVLLVEGWQDAIGSHQGRAWLLARGFEIEVAE